MQNLELFLEKFNKILWGNWLVFVLLGLGILYSIATIAVATPTTFPPPIFPAKVTIIA